jgi:hypothetical protein
MLYFPVMENNHLEKGPFEAEDYSVEAKNNHYVEELLAEYPRTFKELILKDDTKVAILYNDALISQEDKEILPPYDYFAFSKYGLTQFNSSFKGFLGWTITTNAISALIEVSKGEEVVDMVVSEWRKWKRNRINKGLIPLKMVLRSVTVSGVHLEDGIEDFYHNILGKLSFTF